MNENVVAKRVENLLIIENDLLNQKLYIIILSKNYAVKICSSFEEFVAVLEENEYNLVNMDLVSNSGKNSIELIKEQRIV
jgi:ActR/RegA family two-component response regulator